jgi:lipoyl(octanoyl) transferase
MPSIAISPPATKWPWRSEMTAQSLAVRRLGRQPYEAVWRAMQLFTDQRSADSRDELWLVEHPPVFTVGLNGKAEHLLRPGDIPVVQVDRGGQVTYHAPGQIVLYLLLDLRRRQLGVRQLVTLMEQAIISQLAGYGIAAAARSDAPGVYVQGAKVAALGLRIRRGCSYHGLALNVAMDLEPFARINPCGYPGLAVAQLRDLGIKDSLDQIAEQLLAILANDLGYDGHVTISSSLPEKAATP